MTFSEIVSAISDRTGERARQVDHNARSYIKHGLLPGAKIVPIPGSRGTRGDYGPQHVIGYLAIKLLRQPGGKPPSFMAKVPDATESLREARWFARYFEWARETMGADFDTFTREALQGRLPPAPPDLLEERPPRAKTRRVTRLRLNAKELARLIPIARGEQEPGPGALTMTPINLARALGEQDTTRIWLVLEGLKAIWKAVAEVETGETPDDIQEAKGDVVALKAGREMWRLSRSDWRGG